MSLIGQIAFTFIGFLSTMYFAHTVGASVLGGYFLFITYCGIFFLLTDGGFGGAASKRISEGEEQDAYFSAFVALRSFFTIVIIVALIAFRDYFVDINDAGVFIWLLLALIISLFSGAVYSGVAGCGKMGICATGDFIREISRIIIQVVAVFLGYGVAGLACGFVAGMLTAAVMELRFFDLHFVRFGWRHIKSLSSFSFWLFLTSGGIMAYSYTDIVLIGYYMSNADVGVYRVVMQFTSLAALMTNAIRSTLWPKVSRWGKTGEIGLIEESLSRAFSYSLALAVPVFVGGILLGDRLLYYFYSAEFASGYSTLIILLIVQLINVFHFLFTTYLSALDRQKDAFKVTAIAVSANIVINLLLIPIMGIAGAAVATLVTMVLNVVLAKRVLVKIIMIRMEHTTLLNILKASTAMALFVSLYRMIVPLSSVLLTLVPVVLGGLVYGILILKFDRNIYKELRGIAMQMNLPWPAWL